jgi:hypothetical protein
MPVFEGYQIRGGYVRFGSKADVCAAQSRVRFAPNSDRESGFPRKVMSALPPKADVYARFVAATQCAVMTD